MHALPPSSLKVLSLISTLQESAKQQAKLKGSKSQITLEHFRRPDHFILKLSGLLAFFISLLLKIEASAISNASLHSWRKELRCWLLLIPRHSNIFLLQDPQQATQPLQRATASSLKISYGSISPFGITQFEEIHIMRDYTRRAQKMFVS